MNVEREMRLVIKLLNSLHSAVIELLFLQVRYKIVFCNDGKISVIFDLLVVSVLPIINVKCMVVGKQK